MEAIGWIAAIMVGGATGVLCERILSSSIGMLMNVLVGMLGALFASSLTGLLGTIPEEIMTQIAFGFVGACVSIAVAIGISGPDRF